MTIVVGLITLTFAGLWFRGGGRVRVRPRSVPKGIVAGLGSGVTSMVAHSGGRRSPCICCRSAWASELYVGTTSIFFTVANCIKAVPWLLLVDLNAAAWT